MALSVVILTFNSADSIGATLESARQISDDIHVVDSYSSDTTLEISAAAGARVVQHPFENYGAQRNWAIQTLPLAHEWELHLDADERLSPALRDRLRTFPDGFAADVDGYYIPRLVYFMGRPIRHGGMYPIWHMRLFRHGRGRCEDRAYDQHFILDGRAERLPLPMIDDIRMDLGEWVARHNRWADAEMRELISPTREGVIGPRMAGGPIERKRALRRFYEGQPLFLRAFLLFFYRYVLRLGFLDGREGLIFFVLQAFWFHFLVDAKLHEHRLKSADG